MNRLMAALVAALAILVGGSAPPAAAAVATRSLATLTRCAAPSLARTEGAIQLLRARHASCTAARRIATAWDALCRSETDSLCVLRTGRAWRCTRGAAAAAGTAISCRSGERLASFFWAAAGRSERADAQ